MSETAEQLLKKALTLDEQDRAALAGALIESLDREADPEGDVEAVWLEEAERRLAEIKRGEVKTVPGDRVMEELRARLGPR